MGAFPLLQLRTQTQLQFTSELKMVAFVITAPEELLIFNWLRKEKQLEYRWKCSHIMNFLTTTWICQVDFCSTVMEIYSIARWKKNHWENLEQIWHLTVEKKKDEAFLIYSYLDKHFSQNSDYFCLFIHTTLGWGGKCLSLNRNIIFSWIMCMQVYKRGLHNVSVIESNTL